MAKEGGLGGAVWVDEFDLSNDIQSCTVGGGPALLDVTGIDKSGIERIGGNLSGSIDLTAFFNKASGQSHLALASLPTTDTIVTYAKTTATIGDAAASVIAKQVNYDGSRSASGELMFNMQAVSSAGLGLTWGRIGTAGQITETTTGDQTGIDNAGATSAGLRAFIHVSVFSGTDATVIIQESEDNASSDAYATIASFTSITGVGAEAIAVSGAIERWLRVRISVDNFTSMTFAVMIARG